jgi:two-component system sensor histidine kinase UhpB
MQKLVREILGRLRPTPVVELGLDAAIDDLVAFWGARRPDIVFDIHLDLDEARLSDAVEETLYRVVQEGLSNAVRHGRPGRIAIVVTPAGPRELLVQVSDDGAPEAPPAERATTGFGLIGMRERVEACGGVLEVGPAGAGGGWSVAARLPARGKAVAEPASVSA